jgi:histidyl-tRNA synthetase
MKITKLKGTQDFFNQDALTFDFIERKAKEVSRLYGVQEIVTPIMEATEVFSRSVGEETDVVTKEMYTFLDRSDKSVTLRPEGTAGVTRSYVENKMYAQPGLTKLFYFGPMFRAERPQAGRFRQFHQFGVEMIGPGSPYLDADVINMAVTFLKSIGLTSVKIEINTLGSKEGRQRYLQVLHDYFAEHIEDMCEDCKKRLEKNPLRILDCKVDADSEIMKNAPKIMDYLTKEDKNYFKQVLAALDSYHISYEVDSNLVRGLDYYNHTVFEIKYLLPGSSIDGMAIGGGGRYNGLSKQFDGPESEAIGYACGIERLMVLLNELHFNPVQTNLSLVTVINIGDTTKMEGLRLTNYLRNHGVSCQIDYSSSNLKPQFKLAERLQSPTILILGEDEVKNNVIKVKNTIEKTEMELPVDKINEYFNIEGEKYEYVHNANEE